MLIRNGELSCCRLCGNVKKLINSHIIPKGFFKFICLDDNNKSPIMVKTGEKYTKKMPIGWYEKLLCKECDERIGIYDEYAQKVLLKNNMEIHPETDKAFILYEVDYKKLKLFFISILWRASVSSREEFNVVNVGNFENRLRNLILNDNPSVEEDFAVAISRFGSDDYKIDTIAKQNIWNPYRKKIENINHYVFYLSNGFKVLIKVDKRNSPNKLSGVILTNNKPLIILRLDFEYSEELALGIKILKSLNK